jgi:glutathione S-transferase
MMMEDAMKLYGFGPTRTLRALWGLKELGLEFDYVHVDLIGGEAQTPEFLALNPAGKLPVLVDGAHILPESAAIVLYLAEKYPEKGLLPADIDERAQVYRWIMFAMTELEQPLWRITKHSFLYPEEKRLPQDVTLASEEFTGMAKVLERHMEGRSFIVGERFGAADCVTAYLTDWANEQKLLAGLPNLQAYLERMYARPAAPPRIAEAFASVQAAGVASILAAAGRKHRRCADSSAVIGGVELVEQQAAGLAGPALQAHARPAIDALALGLEDHAGAFERPRHHVERGIARLRSPGLELANGDDADARGVGELQLRPANQGARGAALRGCHHAAQAIIFCR